MEKQEKTNNYYLCLPEGYSESFRIDAMKKSTAVILSIVSLVLTVAVFAVTFLIKGESFFIDPPDDDTFILYMTELALFCILLIAYMVLHELTHGLFYTVYTKEKLKFGLTLTCAYCGVPDAYVKRNPMLVTCLAPFVIFSVMSLIAIVLLPCGLTDLLVIAFFSLHFGGCAGDLYASIMLLAKYDSSALINDNGYRQIIYTKEN